MHSSDRRTRIHTAQAALCMQLYSPYAHRQTFECYDVRHMLYALLHTWHNKYRKQATRIYLEIFDAEENCSRLLCTYVTYAYVCACICRGGIWAILVRPQPQPNCTAASSSNTRARLVVEPNVLSVLLLVHRRRNNA